MWVLVTRPEEDARSVAADLEKAGHEVLLEPLLTVEPLPAAEAPIDLTDVQALVFTSATPVGICTGHALGLDDTGLWRLAGVAYNSGVSTLRVTADERRLFGFNSVSHLQDPQAWTFR